MTKNPLYINLHIPKTAGYTLRYHIDKNLKKDEQLLLDYEFLGLNLFKPPLDYEVYRNKAYKLIKSLTREKRDNLKIIHGHTVPYGIHELFDREVRYFTFVRNPIDRTISIYNHLFNLNKKEGGIKRMQPYYEKYFLIKGNEPSFENWLRNKYVKDTYYTHFSTVGNLKEFGYLKGYSQNIKSINDALSKFYFIGLTEYFNEESLYFFKELGMHKYFIDQNISQESLKTTKNSKLYENTLSRNLVDNTLFNKSVQLNHVFKQDHPEYFLAIRKKTLEKKLLLPFTQAIYAPRQTILRFLKFAFGKEPLKYK